MAAVANTGLPVVVHRGPAYQGMPVVGIVDRAAGRAIANEAATGARRPAVLSCPLDRSRQRQTLSGPDPAIATLPVTRHRLEGFRGAHQAGIVVPAALSVTGWDDTDAAAPARLTTVAQSLRDQGGMRASGSHALPRRR